VFEPDDLKLQSKGPAPDEYTVESGHRLKLAADAVAEKTSASPIATTGATRRNGRVSPPGKYGEDSVHCPV